MTNDATIIGTITSTNDATIICTIQILISLESVTVKSQGFNIEQLSKILTPEFFLLKLQNNGKSQNLETVTMRDVIRFVYFPGQMATPSFSETFWPSYLPS